MQTSNLMANTAQKTLVGQEKPITVLKLDDFRESDLEYPNCFAELSQGKQRSKPKPEPHQEEAISAVKEALKDNDMANLLWPVVRVRPSQHLDQRGIKRNSTLVLLPSLSLLSQTMREWAWAGNTEFEILNVCSDQSVGRQTEDMSVNDAPFPVTSDPNEIASFLQKKAPKVVFCTYQSSPLITDAQSVADDFTFDLAVLTKLTVVLARRMLASQPFLMGTRFGQRSDCLPLRRLVTLVSQFNQKLREEA